MMLYYPRRLLSVIITCAEQYHQYLPELLASLERQLVPPDEVVIVYDNTAPSITSYPYLQVDFGNPFLSRKAGFDASTKEVVCFLDADDYISDDYIGAGLVQKTDNNIVYSDVQLFGAREKRLVYSPKFLSQESYLHVACLASRSSIEAAEAFGRVPPVGCHEDWVFWRRLVRAGCPTTKQDGLHYHREHIQNRSKDLEVLPFYQTKGICCDTVGFVQITEEELDSELLVQWFPNTTEAFGYTSLPVDKHILDSFDIGKILRVSTADYILFYDRAVGVDVNSMLQALKHGVVAVQMKDRPVWAGTLVAVDILRSKLPCLYEYPFDGMLFI